MTRDKRHPLTAALLVALLGAGLTAADPADDLQPRVEPVDPFEPLYEDYEVPYNPALGCQPSELTLTSIAPIAHLADPVQVEGYSLGLTSGTALPGPVELRLTLGAGRRIVSEYLDAPNVLSSHNDASNAHVWVVDSVDGGLHPVGFAAVTECQLEGAGPDEAYDVNYFQWDSRQRCAGTDSANNAETRGASDGPAPMEVGGVQVQRDRVSRFVIGLNSHPRVEVGGDYHGALVVGVDSLLNTLAVEVRPANAASFSSRVSADSDVRYCDSDVGVEPHHANPNDPQRPSQYALTRINVQGASADHAWHTTFGTPARNVCVIDTGLRNGHEEFPGARIVAQRDFTSPSPLALDTNGHGTHVAGIAAATTNNALGISGVSQSGVLVAKVFDDTGAGSWSWVASAIRWCADNGGHVINLSLGDTNRGATPPPTAVRDAVTYAWSVGRVLVASSGNNGCPNCVVYPAKYPEVIAVGCTDSADALCTFSNTGPELDLVGPGLNVVSSCHTTNSDYCTKSGTSMSAPQVAGAAALIWSHVPGLTNARVREFLYCGARDLGASGWDPNFGNGIVNVGDSLARAIAGTCTPVTPCSGTINHTGAVWDATHTRFQADIAVTHSPATAHVVAWRFTTSDGTAVTHTDTGHDAKRVLSADNQYRTVTVQVDLACGLTLSKTFTLWN